MKYFKNDFTVIYTYMKNIFLNERQVIKDLTLFKVAHNFGIRLALRYFLHSLLLRFISLLYPILWFLSIFFPIKNVKYIFYFEPTLFKKYGENTILMKCWKKLSASETIYRKTLINAISAENAMREFGISEEVMSTNISQKILFDKLNRDDLRPMPYVKIDHTEVANTPGITTVDVYQPLTPYPYVRYYFLIEVYDFHNIMFDRREFVNFYKIENQLDWIVNVIAEATENILSSIASMNYSLNNNQIRNNQRDDELIRLLNNLQEAVEINIKNRDAELTIINIIKKNINLQKNIDAFSSLLTKTMDEYLIPELEKLGDNVTDDAVKKLAKLLKLKKNTFEDDELYNEFFKVVEDIFTNLSNNAKELSFVVEHKRNIIPKKYNQENVLQYDEGVEKQRKKIVIKEEDFIARFSKLTNQRNARGKRVTLDTVNSYWRILTHFHKLQGRG